MPKVLDTQIVELSANMDWTAVDSIELTAGENLVQIQARTDVAVRFATDRGKGRNGRYMTVKAGTAQIVSSFNFQGERLYLSGPAGTVVELLIQTQP
jgi:hypothetical protein